MTTVEPREADGQLADLFRLHHAELVRLAVLLVHDQPTAEDAVQDVYLKLQTRRRVLGRESEDVVSARNVWAVGGPNGALILHWNGITWQAVPNRWSAGHGWLFGVFARSASDVWAVGTAGFNSLILHWNGVTWTRLGGSRFGQYGSSIVGVDAVSPRLTWLVGDARSGLPLILRWNGVGLRQQARPPPSAGGGLASVSAVSATQAWAVGTGSSRHQPSRSWFMRWQGHGWRRVPSPRQVANATFMSVVAVSANNVWAVGYSRLGSGVNSRALILAWDGTTWRVVA